MNNRNPRIFSDTWNIPVCILLLLGRTRLCKRSMRIIRSFLLGRMAGKCNTRLTLMQWFQFFLRKSLINWYFNLGLVLVDVVQWICLGQQLSCIHCLCACDADGKCEVIWLRPQWKAAVLSWITFCSWLRLSQDTSGW